MAFSQFDFSMKAVWVTSKKLCVGEGGGGGGGGEMISSCILTWELYESPASFHWRKQSWTDASQTGTTTKTMPHVFIHTLLSLSFVLFNDNLVSVKTFGVMYDQTISYICKSLDQISGHM